MPRAGAGHRLLACAAAVLAVAGCTPVAPPAPARTAAASAPAGAGASSAGQDPGAVLSDEELMGLMDRAIKGGPQGVGRVARTADLRARLRSQPAPADQPAVEPGECGVFRPHSSPTSSADLGMNFAAGVLTLTGSWAREALAFAMARSAPRNEVVAADFQYPEELPGKCSTFRHTMPQSPPTLVRVVAVPSLGEKAYALHSRPSATGDAPPAGDTVALQVLEGTVSFGLSRQAPAIATDDELRSALEPLIRLAERLVAEAPGGWPPAPAPPNPPTPNSPTTVPPTPSPPPRQGTPQPAPGHTPDQLVGLLQGITGPGGGPARILQRNYAPSPPSPEPATEPPPSCVYDDAAYLAAVPGAATAVAELHGGAQELGQTSLRLLSLPPSSGQLPFDRRAADLATCASIQEQLPGGGFRAWSSLERPAVDTSGQAGYAVAYTLPDGTGTRHVLVGARKGRLCVEAEAKLPSDDGIRQAADRLAATINKVMAKVGS